MKRLLYVSQSYSTHDERFLKQLVRGPFELYYLPCVANHRLPDSNTELKDVHRLEPLSRSSKPWSLLGYLRAYLRFRKVLKQVQPTLVHAGPLQTGAFLAALSDCHPFMAVSWGSDVLTVPQRNPWLRWITQFTLRRADRVFGDCQTVAEHIQQLSSKDKPILYFPWGIDLEAFRPSHPREALRSELGWEEAFIFICTRAFEPIHAPLTVVEALCETLRRHPSARALLLGEGSLKPDIEAHIKAQGFEDRIRLPGQLPEAQLADYFNMADVYVAGTLSDGSSISLLQAMGSGLPVVVTDGYGNREWVDPQRNGWLYPAGDAAALTRVLCEVIQAHQQRQAMRSNNVLKIRANADWQKNINALLEAHESMLATRSHDA